MLTRELLEEMKTHVAARKLQVAPPTGPTPVVPPPAGLSFATGSRESFRAQFTDPGQFVFDLGGSAGSKGDAGNFESYVGTCQLH